MGSNNRMVGLHQILVGDAPADGATMPDESAMVLLDKVKIDSMSREKEDDTYETVKTLEDSSVDMDLFTEKGKTTFLFESYDFKFDNLTLVKGGSVVAGKWVEPTNAYKGVEKCIRIITDAGKGLHAVTDMPRVKLYGKIINGFSNGKPGTVAFIVTKLTPQNATGVTQPESLEWYKPATPTNPVTDDTAKEFDFDYVENFTDITKYEFSVNAGVAYNDCTVKPLTTVPATPIGDLLVRLKADTAATYPYLAGYDVANTEAFT